MTEKLGHCPIFRQLIGNFLQSTICTLVVTAHQWFPHAIGLMEEIWYVLHHRGNYLVRRQRLAPGEATPCAAIPFIG
jgi:hypothetical protein